MQIKEILIRNINIVKNASYLTIIEVLNLVTPFLALPYIFATIGIENYGKIAMARAIIAFVILVVNWGIDIYIVKDISINRENKYLLGRIVSNVFALKTILFLLSIFVLIILTPYIDFLNNEKLLIICVLTDVLSHILVPIWFFQGIEKMKYLTIFRFINLSIYLLLLFTSIKTQADYWKLPLYQNVGLLITVFYSSYVIFKNEKVPFVFPRKIDMIDTFITSFPFFLSRVATTFNGYVAKLVTGANLSMESVGVLDVAQKIVGVAKIPAGMLNQAIYPTMSKIRNTNSYLKYRYFYLFLFISILTCIAVFVLSPVAVEWFIDTHHRETIEIIRILCLFLFFASITPFLGTSILVSCGYNKEFNRSVILSSLITVAIYILIGYFNLFTLTVSAYILCFSELLIFIIRYFYCKKYKLL